MVPVIIEVAMNGETPVSHNPYVPRLPAEIGEVGLLCLRQGAALLHNHIDDPMLTGDAAAQGYAEGWARSSRSGPTRSYVRPWREARTRAKEWPISKNARANTVQGWAHSVPAP